MRGNNRFLLPISWPFYSLQSTSFQNLGSQYFKTVASAQSVSGFDQAVNSLSVSIGQRWVVKVGHDLWFPVRHGSQEGLKCCFQMRRYPFQPVLVQCFGLAATTGFPDVKEAFFQPVSRLQIGEVFRPGCQDQAFGFVQIAVAMQQNVTVMHQSSALPVGEVFTDRLTNSFQCLIDHLHNMEFIDDNLSLRHDHLNRVPVRRPHIHADRLNAVPAWQAVQEIDNGGFVPIAQQVYDAPIVDVSDDTPGLMQQVDFINAYSGAMGVRFRFAGLCGFCKDAPDSAFVNAYVVSHAGKGSSERFPRNIKHQAPGHRVMIVHVVQWLKKRLAAFSTLVTPSNDVDPGPLASNGDIHKQLGFCAVSIQQRAGAMWATRNYRLLLSGDLEVMRILLHRHNVPVDPAKNIRSTSIPQVYVGVNPCNQHQ